MRKLCSSLPVLLLAGILCLLTVPGPRAASANPSDARRTGKKCDACHITMTSKYLNAVGLYYKRKHTLAGAPLEQLQRDRRGRRSSTYYQPRYQPGRSSEPGRSRR